MIKKTGIILLLVLAAPTGLAGIAFAQQTECPPECVTDTLEIVTWYPSPYSEYEELRLYPTTRDANYCDNDKIGLMYYDDAGTPSFADDDKIMVCKGTLLGWQALGHWQYISGTTDIKSSNSGNVGIGTNNPGYKLDVQGGQINAYGGLCINNDCKTSWSSVSGGMSSSQINTSTVNINAVKGYSKITVDGKNYALPYYTYGNFLVNSKHNDVDCTLAGGIVMNDGANSFCKFSSNAVPVGWSQYQNWSCTKVSASSFQCAGCTGSDGECSTCTPNPGTHSWANIAQECKVFSFANCNEYGGCYSKYDATVCSPIYEIGGY